MKNKFTNNTKNASKRAKTDKISGIDFFGVINVQLLSIANLFHLVWTAMFTAEQFLIDTRLGTDLDTIVFIPWALELTIMPIIAAAVVYFPLCIKKRGARGLFIANAILLGALILQILITNLFIFI